MKTIKAEGQEVKVGDLLVSRYQRGIFKVTEIDGFNYRIKWDGAPGTFWVNLPNIKRDYRKVTNER